MGQQPNIELDISDLPRPVAHPAPARRWRPQRPGELGTPEEVPWGGAYGTTGPDTGYVLRLIAERQVRTVPGETHHNAEVAIASIAAARASHFGRAPISQDVDAAMLLLGYDRRDLPDAVVDGIETVRPAWLANLGHDAAKARDLVAAVPLAVLVLHPDEIRGRMAAGDRLLDL